MSASDIGSGAAGGRRGEPGGGGSGSAWLHTVIRLLPLFQTPLLERCCGEALDFRGPFQGDAQTRFGCCHDNGAARGRRANHYQTLRPDPTGDNGTAETVINPSVSVAHSSTGHLNHHPSALFAAKLWSAWRRRMRSFAVH